MSRDSACGASKPAQRHRRRGGWNKKSRPVPDRQHFEVTFAIRVLGATTSRAGIAKHDYVAWVSARRAVGPASTSSRTARSRIRHQAGDRVLGAPRGSIGAERSALVRGRAHVDTEPTCWASAPVADHPLQALVSNTALDPCIDRRMSVCGACAYLGHKGELVMGAGIDCNGYGQRAAPSTSSNTGIGFRSGGAV